MKRVIVSVLALAAATALPSAASAAVNITGITGNPGFLNGTIQYTPTALNASVGIGRFAMTGVDTVTNAPVDFLTYCADIFHYIHTGSFQIVPLSTIISNPVKRAQLSALLTTADPFIAAAASLAAKKDISAGIQLAAWEIINEAGTSGYALTSGLFRSSGGNTAAARTLAAGYLTNVTSGAWTTAANKDVRVLYSANNQSQIFIASVPEPATWAMMILGFGLIGAQMRYRRRQTVLAYA